MEGFLKTLIVALAFGTLLAESNPTNDDTQREKRGFGVHAGVSAIGHRTPFGFGGLSPEHDDDFLSGGVAKSAALAAAASKAASFKRAKVAKLSKAAHAAQAVALGESALAGKTAAAVKAADKTYNTALSLAHKLSDALHEAETLTSQAWKSLQAAKAVEAAQGAMVYEAQRTADVLSQKQFLSLSELQAAQAAAIKAQAAASKAFVGPKSKVGGLYGRFH